MQYFINIAIIATSGSLAVNIVAESFSFPHVKKVEIEIEDLHPDLEGFSIGELVSYLSNMKGSFHTGTIIKFAGGWPAAPKRPI